MYVCMCVCMHVCMYGYVYVCSQAAAVAGTQWDVNSQLCMLGLLAFIGSVQWFMDGDYKRGERTYRIIKLIVTCYLPCRR